MNRYPALLVVLTALGLGCEAGPDREAEYPADAESLLPTGVRLDPAGPTFEVGPLPCI
jgi:hypothetical protein